MKTCSALIIFALAAGLLGCGSDGAGTSAKTGSEDRTVAEAPQDRTDPEIAAARREADRIAPEDPRARLDTGYPRPFLPSKRVPIEKLVIKDLEVGKGPVARWGDEATVRYVGVYWKTGGVFSQHWDNPYDFELDGEWFGPGWQRGIHGMRVGGLRELRIPAAMVFGKTDAAYIVSLRAVKPGARSKEAETSPGEESSRFATITNRGKETQPQLHPSDRPSPRKVLVRDLEIGTGPAARLGDQVDVYYFGVKYKTGKRSYFRWPSQPPLATRLGDVPWEEALIGMRPGGLREAIIPSRLHLDTGTIDFLFRMVRVEGRRR
jgi:FKBP-type peptidyl-prolyl cis-trans isomerase